MAVSKGKAAAPVVAPPAKKVETKPETKVETKVEVKAPPKAEAKGQAQPNLTQDMIAKRAFIIWEKKGKPHGQEHQNWNEAESELKKELKLK